MNTKKFLTVLKNAAACFVMGAGLVGATMGLVVALVAGFPVVIVAVATLIGGVLFCALGAVHAAWKFDQKAAADLKAMQRQIDEDTFREYEQERFAEIERQLRELRGLEEEQLRLQMREIQKMKPLGLDLTLEPTEKWVSFSQDMTVSDKNAFFFRAPSNDEVYEEEKNAANFTPGP